MTAPGAEGQNPNSLDELGHARRRLAAWLLGAPLAGAALAATGPSAPMAPADGATFTGRWVHGFAAYGPPKYGADFQHFEYVNPDAPKGGRIRVRNPDRRTSFDKFNPWTVRGNAPSGIMIWMVESLAQLAQDEPMTVYGLIAEAIMVEPDFSAVSFRIRPQARFNNGDPVTAEDVKFSHAMIGGKGATPVYQNEMSNLARVVVLDARTVRFEFKEKGRDAVFSAATMPILSRKWGAGKPLDQIVTDYPITSGPYLIDKVELPRRIEFRFNPEYWARELPVRRGHFNFERVVYRLYEDHAVAREAFKAGEFDLYRELRSRSWVRQHKGVKWDDGRIQKATLKTWFGNGLQSYILNMRRPLFQDIRVREAIGLSFDFETSNKTGLFTRSNSEFNNSDFAAQGLPGPGERKLLEPFRAELPATVFGPAFVCPSTANDPGALRRNLLRARTLLEQAGWKLAADGKLRNEQGQAFEFEYLTPGEAGINDWQRNLAKLGIALKERNVDFALYRRRLQAYDYDMVGIAGGTFTLPVAADMAALFGSKSADEPGNSNFRGIKSRAMDAMIAAMARADSMDELRDAARALDRVLMWNHYQVPEFYKASENFSYWNRFGAPQVPAKYFSVDMLITGFVEWGPWPLWTWWDKSLEKRAS